MPIDRNDVESTWRLWLLRLLAAALVLTAIVAWRTTSAEDGVAGSATIEADGTSDPDGPIDPSSIPAPPAALRIDRIWSPEPFTARIEGAAPAPAEPVDVIVDGTSIGTVVLWTDGAGAFVQDVGGLSPGAQTLCLDIECGRVLVADQPTGAGETTETRIDQAIELALGEFPLTTYFPDWAIRAAGPGPDSGTTDRTIVISAGPAQSSEELVVTVLREMAHVIDAELMNDESRAAFGALRGHDPSLPWRRTGARGNDPRLDGAEDFSEVFVAWVRDGAYEVRSTAVAPQPRAADLAAFCAVIAVPGIEC